MSAPRTTIVIATHNRRSRLQEALGCALNQTERDLEVLVVDDASADDTQAWTGTITDSRVEVIRNPQKLGAAASWRAGIENARGEFVAFLPDDDSLEPSFVAARLSRLEPRPECMVAFSRYRIETDDGRTLAVVNRDFGEERVLDPRSMLDAALGQRIFLGTGLYRRNAFDDLPDRVLDAGAALDYAINVEIALRGGSGIFIPIDDFVYREHEGQTRHDSSWQRRYQRRADFLSNVISERSLPKDALWAVRRELSSWHTVWGRRLLEQGDRAAARSHFVRAVKSDVRNPWSWKQLARSSAHRPKAQPTRL
jgi:glycosyltransferase involved in cell wall biosynthesis